MWIIQVRLLWLDEVCPSVGTRLRIPEQLALDLSIVGAYLLVGALKYSSKLLLSGLGLGTSSWRADARCRPAAGQRHARLQPGPGLQDQLDEPGFLEIPEAKRFLSLLLCGPHRSGSNRGLPIRHDQ